MTADGGSLGAPACSKSQRVYLKAVFACVAKDVLKPEFQDPDRHMEEEEEDDEGPLLLPPPTITSTTHK